MSAAFDYSPYVTPEISQRRKQGALRSNQSTALPTGGKCNVDNKYQQNKTVCSPQALHIQRKGGVLYRDTKPMADVLMMTPEPSPASPMRPLTQAHTDPFAEDRKRDLGRRPRLLTPEPKQDPPRGKRCDPEAMMESPPATNIYGVRIHKKMVDGGVNAPARGNLFGGTNAANVVPTGKEKSPEKLPDTLRFRNSLRFKGSLGRTEDPMTPAPSQARVMAKRHACRKHMETPDVPAPKPKPYKFTTPFARTGSVAASVKLHGRKHFEKPHPRTLAHEDALLAKEEREKLLAQTNSPQRRYLNSKRWGQANSAPYARDTSFPPQLAPRYAKKPVFKKPQKTSVFPEDN